MLILEYAMKDIAMMGLWFGMLIAMAIGGFRFLGLKFKRRGL